MSVRNTRSAAGRIVLVRPNSAAALSEFMRVAAGVGEAEHLRAGALRLEEIGGEVRGRQRHADVANHLPAARLDDIGGRRFQLFAERIIGGEEEPALAALFDDRPGGAVGERGRVVAVMDHIRRAVLASQRRACRADGDERDLLLLGRGRHGEADPGVGAAKLHRQAAGVGPFARISGAAMSGLFW